MAEELAVQNETRSVHLVARSPQEMAAAQEELSAWLKAKVAAVFDEVSELKDATEVAIQNKWQHVTLANQLAKARQRHVYYVKLFQAVKAGYSLVLLDEGGQFKAGDDAELRLYLRLTIAERLLTFSIPVKKGAYELHGDGSMKTFGMRRLGPGTWLVEPSVNMPDAPEPIHVYLVLCEVPHPAPWEALHAAPLHGAALQETKKGGSA